MELIALKEAFELLKSNCASHGDSCKGCIFDDGELCAINNEYSPYRWEWPED